MTENLDAFIVIGNLTSLPEKLLHNMKKLRYLNIASNCFKELNPNFLINAPSLEAFVAHGNNFQDQNDIAYSLNGRTNLKDLILNDNNFSNFDFRFFFTIPKTKSIAYRIE